MTHDLLTLAARAHWGDHDDSFLGSWESLTDDGLRQEFKGKMRSALLALADEIEKECSVETDIMARRLREIAGQS